MIETPCWVRGAATVEDLALVFAWNEMSHLRNADAGDAEQAVTMHLTGLCQRLCPY